MTDHSEPPVPQGFGLMGCHAHPSPICTMNQASRAHRLSEAGLWQLLFTGTPRQNPNQKNTVICTSSRTANRQPLLQTNVAMSAVSAKWRPGWPFPGICGCSICERSEKNPARIQPSYCITFSVLCSPGIVKSKWRSSCLWCSFLIKFFNRIVKGAIFVVFTVLCRAPVWILSCKQLFVPNNQNALGRNMLPDERTFHAQFRCNCEKMMCSESSVVCSEFTFKYRIDV